MNFNDVNIDLLNYAFVNKNIKEVFYNHKKTLELWTPVVFVNKIKDSYKTEYIQFDLDEYPRFLELIKCIDLHAMILNDITEDTKDKFKSSLYNSKLSCKIPMKKHIVQTKVSVNKFPGVLNDLRHNDKASCLIYLDQVYIDSSVTLKWKIKKVCVYRNDK